LKQEYSDSDIWVAVEDNTGNEFVLKVLPEKSPIEANVMNLINNKCEFICGLQEILSYNTDTIVILEYCKGKDLATLIEERKENGVPFTNFEICQIIFQLCSALEFLHEKGIIHRDVKASNIFLDENGNIKLGDFGVSRILSKTTQKARTIVGTKLLTFTY
jgi:serine/threonine protein kinase